jgi:PAS domain-containing protein
MNMDLNHQQRSGTSLSAAEAHLSALIESIQDDIYSVDLDFRIVKFNKVAQERIEENHFGKPLRVGMLPDDYLWPEGAAIWREYYQRALSEGRVREEYQTHTGRTLGLSLSRIVQDGVVTGISVFGKDITAQRAAEKARLEAVKDYQEIFDGAIEGIYRRTMDGKTLVAKTAFV